MYARTLRLNIASRAMMVLIAVILISSACSPSTRSNQPFDSIFGENIQEPYDQATEEEALKTYVNNVDSAWESAQLSIRDDEGRVDSLIDTIDAMSVTDELLEFSDEVLSQLMEELETTKTAIAGIQNQYKLIVPLTSGKDFIDYENELNNIVIAELDFHNNNIGQLIAGEEDPSSVEDQVELELSGLSRSLFAFEQIQFDEDVQDFMIPYVEYAEAMVIYLSLIEEQADQAIVFVSALLDIKADTGEDENVDEQAWNKIFIESTKVLLIQDYLTSVSTPVLHVEGAADIVPGKISSIATDRSCGSFKMASSRAENILLFQPVDITCPDITELEREFLGTQSQKWAVYVKQWKIRVLEGERDLWKDYIKETHESNRPLPMLEQEYNQNRSAFLREMDRELRDSWSDFLKEIEEWYKQTTENITNEYSLTITAAHQMFVAGYPNYTIEVSGSHVLTLNPLKGIFGIGQFPMTANWPMGYGAALFGGDTITTIFRGNCSGDIFYITVVNEAGGTSAQGTIVHPKGPTPVTVTRWIRSAGSAYEMSYAFSGSGEVPPKTFSAAELYPDLGGSVSWALEVNH